MHILILVSRPTIDLCGDINLRYWFTPEFGAHSDLICPSCLYLWFTDVYFQFLGIVLDALTLCHQVLGHMTFLLDSIIVSVLVWLCFRSFTLVYVIVDFVFYFISLGNWLSYQGQAAINSIMTHFRSWQIGIRVSRFISLISVRSGCLVESHRPVRRCLHLSRNYEISLGKISLL